MFWSHKEKERKIFATNYPPINAALKRVITRWKNKRVTPPILHIYYTCGFYCRCEEEEYKAFCGSRESRMSSDKFPQ